MNDATDKAEAIGDDMIDADQELPSHEPVREAVVTCNGILTEPYRQADARALSQQKLHRGSAVLAAILGTLAVLLAVWQLGELLPGRFPMGLEVAAVGVGTVAVILGLRLSFQSRWQVERNKAERCRLLKFRFLIDPDYWCADAELRGDEIPVRRVFHDLWCCEQILEFEHREWLRLMIEAEWY